MLVIAASPSRTSILAPYFLKARSHSLQLQSRSYTMVDVPPNRSRCRLFPKSLDHLKAAEAKENDSLIEA